MPRWLQLTLHGVIIAGAYVVANAHGLPGWVPLAAGALQMGLGGVAQGYNTNGSPQSQPFPSAPLVSTAGGPGLGPAIPQSAVLTDEDSGIVGVASGPIPWKQEEKKP
jgi:hypothetical protein